jgi:hypothetical protein
MMIASKSAVRLSLLALGIWFLTFSGVGTAADPKDPLIPAADYDKTLEAEVKVLEEALKAPKDKGQPLKAKVAAILVAAIAQDDLSGANAGQRATVRDAALKVYELVDQKKFDDAKKKAEELLTLKADPAAKAMKVKLSDKVSAADLMTQFSPPKAGLGYEKVLIGLDKGKVDEKTPIIAQHVAIIAELTRQITPDKTPKKWEDFADSMRANSIDLAAAAVKKDTKAVKAAVSKLNSACGDCHGIYRKQ